MNIKTIFPALIPVFSCIRMLSRLYLVDKNIELYPLFICIVMFFAEIIGGSFNFVFLVQEIKDSREKKIQTVRSPKLINGFDPIMKPIDTLRIVLNLLILFGLALIESVSTIVYFGISATYKDLLNIEFNMKSIQIIFTLIFSSFIFLHYPIYKHQLVSIVFIIIGIILVTVLPLFTKEDTWIVILFWVVYFFLWSIKEVVEKILIEVYFLKPLFILFAEGLMGLAIVFIFVLICNMSGNYEMFGFSTSIAVWEDEFDGEAFGILIGYFLGNFGLYICLILTNKFYSPITKTVADSISNVLWWIISVIFFDEWANEEDAGKALSVIGYIFICLGCIMFNEVLIFYFWGLHENTRTEIISRGTQDYEAEQCIPLSQLEIL